MTKMKIFFIVAAVLFVLLLLYAFKFMAKTIREKGDLSKPKTEEVQDY